MKKYIAVLLSLSICATLTGCAKSTDMQEKTFYAMDTFMDFTIYGDAALLDDAEKLINTLEDTLSVTKSTSEIALINQNGYGTVTGYANDLMTKALNMCQRTDGALDISIYPIVRSWGFTTGRYQIPDDNTISNLLSLVDYTRIQYNSSSGDVVLPAGMEIDLGSVAKGYAGQKVADLLKKEGITSAFLNLGGNVQTIGNKPDGSPWQVAIKNPVTTKPMMVVSVSDQSVVTSGGYERYFEQEGKRYWHIMDPATGRPADSHLLSVTIIGDDGMICDGLSTSLFIMGLEKSAELWMQSDDFEAVFVTDTEEVYITDGLRERFALTEEYKNTPVRVIER